MKIQYFKNGKFYSLLSEKDYFSHLLSIDGKIAFTSDEEIPLKRLFKKGYDIKVIDLDGNVCIPSFCDSHVHFMYPVMHIDDIDLSKTTSYKQVLREITEFYHKTVNINDKRWVLGGGWDKNNWSDRFDNPSAFDLKELDKTPIILFSKDYHSVWLNKNAMRTLNVEKPDKNILNKLNLKEEQFFEGVIKDNNGDLTGIFQENAARYIAFLISINYQLDEEQILQNIEKVVKIFNSYGITAITDCSSIYSDSPFRYLQKIPIDRLSFRSSISIPEDALDNFIFLGLSTGMGSDQLRIGGLKILYDGSLGSQTGLMLFPYDNTDNIGKANIDFERLLYLAEKAISHQIGLTIHAIGDRATLDIANLFEFARNLDSKIPLRMEHAQTLTDETIQKLRFLNIKIVMQPVHIDQDISSANRLLKDRINLLYRFNSLLNNKISIAFSSDYPVAPLNPFYGIFCAIKHQGFNLSKEKILNQNESISIFQALKAYTTFSHQFSQFNDCGILSENFSADFIVLNKDIFELKDPHEILDIKVLNTYFKGEIAY